MAGLITSAKASDSTSASGKLYVRAADKLTVKYTDAGNAKDSVTSSTITMIPDTTTSTGTGPVQVTTSDSIAPIISDTDQNLNGDAVETITVTVTNWATGETEVLTLTEMGKNTGVFDVGGLTLSILSGDSTSGGGRLYVKPGDTVSAKYTDPTDGRDSFTTATIGVIPDTSNSTITAASPVNTGDSVYVIVSDSDQNLDGNAVETMTVTVTNWTTGETEVVTLTETGKNTGIFGLAGLPTSTNASDSTSSTGKLYVRSADTFSEKYIDPTDAKDSATSSTGQFLPASAASSGIFPAVLLLSDSVSATITDTDQNLNGTATETVTVTITNQTTGETETLTLTEIGANSSIFDMAGLLTSAQTSDSPSASGKLYVRAADTLTVKYTDQTDAADSVTSGAITTIPDTSTSYGTAPLSISTADSIAPIVSDSDQNLNGDAVETIMITITNGVTGETEILTLTETGKNTGVFDVSGLTLSILSGDSTSVSGKLYVKPGDTVTAKYTDPTDAKDSFTTPSISIYPDTSKSYGTSPLTISTADSIAPIVSDSDQNLNGDAIETITVTIMNGRTGETEILTLTETGKNTGIFDIAGLTLSILPDDSTSVSGKLYVKPGDTVTAKYTDPTDAKDSFTTPSIGIYPDTSTSYGTSPLTISTADSIAPIVSDSDQNLNGDAIETITVTIRNGMTGETETLTPAMPF